MAQKSGTTKCRNYCFTWNNYTEDNLRQIEQWANEKCNYAIYGFEVCPSTGTKHLQGFMIFKNARTWNGVVKDFKGWHLQICKGSPQENFDYCSKSESADPDREIKFVEFGKRPEGQGKRTDLDEIKKKLISGDKLKKVVLEDCENYQQLKYAEGISKYINPKNTRRTNLQVLWFWGETHKGKSETAENILLEKYGECWRSNDTLKWWDGYNDQKGVIFEDLRGNHVSFSLLLRYLDVYAIQVPIKCGFRDLEAETIIITSPFHPEDIYDKSDEDVKQLTRRITEIREFGKGVRKNKQNEDSYKNSSFEGL